MNLSEILIVYLAFGSPFAVHQYLVSGVTRPARRLAESLVTLLFWIPLAVRLARRHYLHAYLGREFVSEKILDAENIRITVLSEAATAELIGADPNLSLHQVRDVIDRYVGLWLVSGSGSPAVETVDSDLFRAAGRSDQTLAMTCLIRKQQRHIERHLEQARRDVLKLCATEIGTETPYEAIRLLADELGDNIVPQSLSAHSSSTKIEIEPGRRTEINGGSLRPVSFTMD